MSSNLRHGLNLPPTPALKRRGRIFKRSPLIFKEGLGWLILGLCAILFCPTTAHAQNFDTCAYLRSWRGVNPSNAEEAKEQYDTLRLYIEKCAATDDDSYDVFVTMSGAVQIYSMDTTRFDTY